ncbi:MAG TPA: DHA2 family efflux MFS transporter permease subunit [Candidatus Tectomicrobia bacterium]|nr:DHA2 family efflux MFS transporter permease subunit [Candidatus Tectomicrobia bacterium]
MRRWIVAVTTMMATFLCILDVTIANVALDHMRGTLSAGVDEITWVLTSFLVANAISLPITGWLTDVLGRKRLFILSTVLFTLTSAAAGAAPSLAVIVAARFVQGLAGGPLVPLSQATMMETFPPHRRGMAMAVWGIGIMFAPIVGPTLGGWITDNWSWRWIFYLNVPFGVLAVVLAWLVVPEPAAERPEVRRVDVPGLVLLVVGVGALQFVLDRGQREDWFASPLITWLTVVAGLALALLVARELRAPHPVVDLRVLRHGTFAVATAAMFVISTAFYGIMVLSPLFTQILMGYTALLAGLVLAPGGVATLVTMPIAGALMNRIDPRWIICAGCGLNALAMAMMAMLTLEASYWQIMTPRFIQGLGIGFTFVPLSTVALSAVPMRDLGHASGLFNFIRTIGGGVGIAGVATLLERGAQIHQARLVGHVSLYDPDVWVRYHDLVAMFAARGADPATAEQQAWAYLYEVVQRQALFLSFVDDFWRLAWIFAAVVPFVLFLGRRPRPAGGRREAEAAAVVEG